MTRHIKNLEAFDMLVDTIRNIDNSATSRRGFHMSYSAENADTSDHPCGTACCIGGWASVLTGFHAARPGKALMDMAGISFVDAGSICYPDDSGFSERSGWDATPEQAVSLLLHYRETGIVDWDRAMGVEA